MPLVIMLASIAVLLPTAIGADGNVARCHLRDASRFQWPLLAAAI